MTSTKPAFELEFTRVLDVPRQRVYEAWSKPEQLIQWFAPKPFTLIISHMDFRPGGTFAMAMRGPDGTDFPFTGTYREITPTKISWNGEFPGDPKDNMLTVITFEDEGVKTKLHARQTFNEMTPTVRHATAGAKQGWTMTLNQLADFVVKKTS